MTAAAGLLSAGGLPTRVGRALTRSGVGRWVALVPTPWFLVNDILGSLGASHGLIGWLAVPGVLAQLLVIGWLAVPLFARLRSTGHVRAWQPLLLYAACGLLRAAILVALAGPLARPWDSGSWLATSFVVGNLVWLTGSALLVHWAGQVRTRRSELGREYARLTSTRSQDVRALAEAERELASVRAATHTALAEIHDRLGPGMGRAGLDEVVARIDDVVAGLVRPTSHDLARMPPALTAPETGRLWMGWRQVVPAVLHVWPAAEPYQPALVGALCLPLVLASVLVPVPHAFGASSYVAMAGLLGQLGLLAAARLALQPALLRLPARGAIGVVLVSYAALFGVGAATLRIARVAEPLSPVEAFLAPAVLAMVSGGVSAAAFAQAEEAAAARAVIQRTRWTVRRTRQQLWAQRRRLALALHGRVQANLTAASLVLRAAGESMGSDGSLDPAVIAQVRHTLTLADWIDQGPQGAPRDRLESIAAVWEGVLHVGLDLRHQAEDVLEANRDAADACTEVLREILLNAVRHGRAESADVVVGLDHATLVCVRVVERRSAPAPAAGSGPPGIGRTLIDSLAVDWAERDLPGGRITVVLLAGTSAAPQAAVAASRLDDIGGLT